RVLRSAPLTMARYVASKSRHWRSAILAANWVDDTMSVKSTVASRRPERLVLECMVGILCWSAVRQEDRDTAAAPNEAPAGPSRRHRPPWQGGVLPLEFRAWASIRKSPARRAFSLGPVGGLQHALEERARRAEGDAGGGPT